METHKYPQTEAFVRDLMPHASEKEIEEAIENFVEYLKIVKDIADRLEREGKSLPTTEEMAAMEKKMKNVPEDGRKPKGKS